MTTTFTPPVQPAGRWLRAQFAANRIRAREVAGRSGLSLRTVSRILAGEPVGEATRARLLHALRELELLPPEEEERLCRG